MKTIVRSAALFALAPVVLALFEGCASEPASPPMPERLPEFIASQSPSLQPFLKQLYSEGERNAVLNFNRLGIAAMVAGQPLLAQRAFDQSIRRIESVRTGGKDLEAAKSKFSTEASKDFKGEPYEKAMVYYYRGLLYLHAGDHANAAASFAQVNVEDSVAEQESYQADFASAKFLQAWSLHCGGESSSSEDLYRQAVEMRADLKDLDYRNPVLAIVESGLAPNKVGNGKYHEQLSWADGGGDVETVALQVGAPIAEAPVKAESLYFQASTRGGRPVEYLLQGKASFRDGAKTAADIGSAVAVASLMNADFQQRTGNMQAAATSGYLSLASSLFSLVSSAVEHNTTPAADTRAWDTLPGSVWLATPRLKGASIDGLRVRPAGAAEDLAPQMTGRVRSCAVSWARVSPLPALRPSAVEAIDSSSDAVARLRKFRDELPSVL